MSEPEDTRDTSASEPSDEREASEPTVASEPSGEREASEPTITSSNPPEAASEEIAASPPDPTDAASVDAQADVAQPESAAGEGAEEAAPDAPQASEQLEGEQPPAEGAEQPDGERARADGAESGKKKRRRRRRKKKKGAAAEGEGAEAGAQAGSDEEDRKKEASLPFLRFFEGEHPREKRHAFAAGEIVAGRVLQVDHGAVRIDLFGKAVAIMDAAEPREVPIVTEPEPDRTTQAGGFAAPTEPEAATEPATDAAATADTTAAPGTTDTAAAPDTVAAPDTDTAAAADTAAAPDTHTAPEAVPVPEAEDTETLATETDAPDTRVSVTEMIPVGDPQPVATTSATETAPGADAALTAESDAPGATQAGELPATEAAPPEPPPPPPPPPRIGEILRGRIGAVSESGHVVIVNRIVDRAAAKARLEQVHEHKERVEGIVFGFNRGGFDVLVEGVRAFCPASGMALEHIDDPEQYVGRKLEFTVPPRKGGAHGIVVSRKNILEREQRKARKARLKSLEPGQRLTGRVTQVREFGIFVDIGDGLEGLVHQSELSWVRGTRPADVAKPGDTLEVQVLETKPETKKDRQGRVSLSVRALLPDPWDQHELTPGTTRKGKVVSTTEFGAFVELAPGIEGLLHVSELGKDLKHANMAVKEGDELDVVIERVDPKQRRISLSKLSAAEAKAVEEGALDLSQRPKSLKPGSHVTVVIDKVEHHGMQVQVRGVLGRRGRGYLPNRELGSLSGEQRRNLQPGAEIEVKIVGADRDGGLRVSIKGKEVDEERKAVREYRKEAAKQGLGTFGDLLRQKLQQPADGSGDQ